jgi:hypothetical protein
MKNQFTIPELYNSPNHPMVIFKNTIYVMDKNTIYSYKIPPTTLWEKFLDLIGQW